jgi:hypothetical protein
MADQSNVLAMKPSGPTTDDVQSKATKGFAALHIVSAAAHAIRNTILEPIPDVETDDDDLKAKMAKVKTGVADVQKKLDHAKVTAAQWTDTLCTRISVTIPTHIIDYSAVYDAASDQILEMLKEADAAGSDPKKIADALDLITALKSQVQDIKKDIDAAGVEIGKYATAVQADHDALVGGVDSIHQLMEMDSEQIKEFKQDIDRLNDEIAALNKKVMDAEIGVGASIFVGIIGIALCATGVGAVAGGAVIAVGVVGLGTSAAFWGVLETQIRNDRSKIQTEQAEKNALDQQLTSLTGLHATVANALDQVTMAQAALSDVGVLWGAFDGVLGGVIADLSKPNANLKAVIDEMWVKAAKNNWQKLSEFAQQLLDTPVKVEVRKVA